MQSESKNGGGGKKNVLPYYELTKLSNDNIE